MNRREVVLGAAAAGLVVAIPLVPAVAAAPAAAAPVYTIGRGILSFKRGDGDWLPIGNVEELSFEPA